MAKKEKEAKTSNKENSKNKKSFWKSFKAELKKVSWPTPKQLANNTVAVITIVLITVVIVFALDITFEALNKHGVDKIKEVISSQNDTTNENATTDENSTITDENTTTDENSTTNEITENGENTTVE